MCWASVEREFRAVGFPVGGLPVMSERQPNHYLLVSARAYTGELRATFQEFDTVQWSAPATVPVMARAVYNG